MNKKKNKLAKKKEENKERKKVKEEWKRKKKLRLRDQIGKLIKKKKKTTVFTNHAYQSYNIQSLV